MNYLLIGLGIHQTRHFLCQSFSSSILSLLVIMGYRLNGFVIYNVFIYSRIYMFFSICLSNLK